MKTFANENSLPSLPLPDLHHSCELYLKSVEALLIDRADGEMSSKNVEVYVNTKQIVDHFLENEGKILDTTFKSENMENRNWLENLWDYLYLSIRDPTALYVNFGGPKKHFPMVTNVKDVQEWNASIILVTVLEYWRLLRSDEHFEVDKTTKNEMLSMHQYRYVFNSCRIPGKKIDSYVNAFGTVQEAPNCPSHCIIFCNKRIFKIDIDGLLCKDVCKLLIKVRKMAVSKEGQGLAAMTYEKRDTWSEFREWLIHQSDKNAKNLDLIEKAICCLTLDETKPKDPAEMIWRALYGDPANRWADKTNSYVLFADGSFNSCCEHTKVDGLIHVNLCNL